MSSSSAVRYRLFPYVLALAIFIAAPFAANAASPVYLTLTLDGTVIEGESTVIGLGRENTIECFSFSQAGFSDTSRTPPGQRSYRPVTIRKRVGKSSPLLMRAWAQGQRNGSAVFRFYRPTPTGADEQHYTIELVNPQIVSVSTSVPDTLDPATSGLPELETVSFVFEQIIYTDEISGASYTDAPSGP